MERRHGIRLPVQLTIHVEGQGPDQHQFHAKNMGYGGLFLENYQSDHSQHNFLSLDVTLERNCVKKTYPMKAIVVHRSLRGSGLMWADHYSSVRDAVDEIMVVALNSSE